jgi:hypothetical protein
MAIFPSLFSWAVLGSVALLLIGIGFAVMSMTPPDFTIARVCFSAAAVILALKAVFWLVELTTGRIERIAAAFLIFGLIGAAWIWSYSWVSFRQSPVASGVGFSEDQDPQYAILNLSPEEKAKIDAQKAPLFRYKAAVLDTPEYYKARAAKDKYRAFVESVEAEHGCLIDPEKVQCLPKPPKDLKVANNDVDIDVPVRVITDIASPGHFWIIHDQSVKLRIPVVLFVSLTNRRTEPIQISLVYLEAKGVGGWADVRMADTLTHHDKRPMENRPLILQAANACMSVKGEDLLPSLYDRVLQPGDKVEGWVVAEYPKGFKDGNSIGEMRISLVSANHWIASKVFNGNPRTFGDDFTTLHGSGFYFVPLDTLITEEQ